LVMGVGGWGAGPVAAAAGGVCRMVEGNL